MRARVCARNNIRAIFNAPLQNRMTTDHTPCASSPFPFPCNVQSKHFESENWNSSLVLCCALYYIVLNSLQFFSHSTRFRYCVRYYLRCSCRSLRDYVHKNDDLAKNWGKFDGILSEVDSFVVFAKLLTTHTHRLFVEWLNKSFTRYLNRFSVQFGLFAQIYLISNRNESKQTTIENRLRFHSLRILPSQSHIVFQFPQRWFVLYRTVFLFMYKSFTL